MRHDLPVMAVCPDVVRALEERGGVVVTAPPGAGKSTGLPLAVLDAFPDGKIIMLEPRRVAARQIAERMAWMLGEPVGKTVGYRMRFEQRVGAATRIEVVTEGILVRRLQDDPGLEGVSVVIFDEFHERSLTVDVALALTREVRKVLRPDLKLVLMSATLDAARVCAALDLPLVGSRGRSFPVEVVRPGVEAAPENAAETVAHFVRVAHRDHAGDILAFLPGEGEIRRCAELLGDSLGMTRVYPLYGMLPPEEQRAIQVLGEEAVERFPDLKNTTNAYLEKAYVLMNCYPKFKKATVKSYDVGQDSDGYQDVTLHTDKGDFKVKYDSFGCCVTNNQETRETMGIAYYFPDISKRENVQMLSLYYAFNYMMRDYPKFQGAFVKSFDQLVEEDKTTVTLHTDKGDCTVVMGPTGKYISTRT